MSISNGIKQLSSPLQLKHGTSETLEASDYVLAAGEIITATDTGDIRAGNGTGTWKELPSSLSEATNTEIHVLTEEEVVAKSFGLNSAVATGKENQVILFISGVAQAAGIDFIASGSTISWEDKGLDDIELRAGDVFIVQYTKTKADSVLNGSSIDTDMLKILMADADVLTYHNAGTHNCLYRGKDLGSKLTEEQSAAIRAGTFEGIYVGDYWTFENIPYGWETYYGSSVSGTYGGPIRMRVADCDYYFNTGETAIEMHHVVVVPDENISGFDNSMNDNLTTEGGYVGSMMYIENLKAAESIIKTCFGEGHVLPHQEYLVNAVTSGRASAGAWVSNRLVDLMDERMVYGSCIFDSASTNGGNTIPNRNSLGCKQFNLFRYRPDLICSREPYWLRNIVSDSHFSAVDSGGDCTYYPADSFGGNVYNRIRPYALIY